MALLAGLLFSTNTASAQPTLMFRFPPTTHGRRKITISTPASTLIILLIHSSAPPTPILYAYEKGSLLIDRTTPAPARRVQTFLFDNDYVTLTPAGLKLVSASVAWLLATPAPV